MKVGMQLLNGVVPMTYIVIKQKTYSIYLVTTMVRSITQCSFPPCG